MYLIYFDEVKDNSSSQNYFWLGGIGVDTNHIKTVEKKISDISNEYFNDPCIGRKTEFHAAEIYHRKRIYKGWSDPTKRIELIAKLFKILDNELIKKIYVKIEKKYFDSKFSRITIDELAFMFLCEKANSLMSGLKDIGMLIGDRENTSIATRYAERLSNWRHSRTEYAWGTEIKNLIDTVHFTESHLSRMLQLADIHIWCRQFYASNYKNENGIPKLMVEEMKNSGDAFFASKYKEYPLNC
jgi:hypothetical protein